MIIRCRIQIEGGNIEDSYDRWGFIYIDSDNRTAPPEKERSVSSYAEEDGDHPDKRTVLAPFDYKVKFAISAPNSDADNANEKITAFNEAVRQRREDGVIICKEITLYDDRKRAKIIGIPNVVDEADVFYRRADGSRPDCVEFPLTIKVSRPELCSFNMKAADMK